MADEEFDGSLEEAEMDTDTVENEDVQLNISSKDLQEDEELEAALEAEGEVPYPGDGEFPPESPMDDADREKTALQNIESEKKNQNKLSSAEKADRVLPEEFENTPEMAEALRKGLISDRSLGKAAEAGFAERLKGEHWVDLAEGKAVMKKYCREANTYNRHEMRLESEAVWRYCNNEDEKPTRTIAVAVCALVVTIGGMIIARYLGAPLWITVAAVILWSMGVVAVLAWSLRSFNRERLRIQHLRLYHQMRLMCLGELVKEDKKAKEDEEKRKKDDKQRQMDERDSTRKPYQLEPLGP